MHNADVAVVATAVANLCNSHENFLQFIAVFFFFFNIISLNFNFTLMLAPLPQRDIATNKTTDYKINPNLLILLSKFYLCISFFPH